MPPVEGTKPVSLEPERLPDPTLPDEPIDLRLVVADMDGTLLDGDGRVPPEMAGVLQRLLERGIVFAPASGRQLPSLQRTLGPLAERIDGYIAENGGLVVHHGVDITSSVLPSETVAAVVHGVRQLVASGRFDLGLIVSCHDWAYAERKDPRFLDAAGRFYTNLRSVADLLTHTHDALKLSIYDFGDSHASADSVAALCPDAQVVVASEDWVDVMNVGVNKGVALAQLQAALGVTPAQTVAFGDYLNDLEMLAQAEHSFAMANAHPEAIDTAAYVAPSNLALGVVATLNHLLDQLPSAN